MSEKILDICQFYMNSTVQKAFNTFRGILAKKIRTHSTENYKCISKDLLNKQHFNVTSVFSCEI